MPCIANGELRGVDSHGDPARARIYIVACQRALPAFVELALGDRTIVFSNLIIVETAIHPPLTM
jgi:hypothetical protein